MVDIEVFMKSLKITWIRRLFRYNNAPWMKFLQAETSICLTKISHFGPQYLSEMIRTFNPFWQDVFEGWIGMSVNVRIYNNIEGVGTIYRIFHTNFQNDHKMKSRWNQEFEICIDHDTWRMLFSICFKTVTNNNLIWFQLKLIYRILGTNSYLHELGIRNSPNCRFCQQPESLLHIFYECPNSSEL